MRSPAHIVAMIGLATLASARIADDSEILGEPEPRRARQPSSPRQAAKVQTKTGNRECARRLRQQAAIEAKRNAARATGAA